MTQFQIRVDAGMYQVYVTEFGVDRQDRGPKWPTPREAARYADLIATPYVPPIRSSDEDTHLGDRGPLTPADGAVSSSDGPRGSSRRG